MGITQYSLEDRIRTNIIQYAFLYKSVFQPNSKTHFGIDVKTILFEDSKSLAGQVFAERKISKTTTLQFQWHNIFFTENLNYLFNTPNSRGYSSFQLVPTYLLTKIAWQLR
jgi:hypothetical protein